MSLNDEERAILVKREYEKALSFYSQAEENARIGIWDVVANRLYYATFHAVSANSKRAYRQDRKGDITKCKSLKSWMQKSEERAT